MRIDNNFLGYVRCEIYYKNQRERINTQLFVEQLDDNLIIRDEYNDIKWRAEYLEDGDEYVIVNNWCKGSDCWDIRKNVENSMRIRIKNKL